MILTNYRNISRRSWRNFIKKQASATVFHTPEMVDIYIETPGYEPLVIATIDDQEEVTGLLIAVVQSFKDGFFQRFAIRSVVFGAPLVKDGDLGIADQLLRTYNELAQERGYIYTQVRNLTDMGFMSTVFQKNGYRYEDHLDIWVDLLQSEDVLWKDIHRRRRSQIRRAERMGVEVKSFGLTELDNAYSILKDVYHRARLPLVNKQLFQESIKVLLPQNRLQLWAAYYNGKMVSVLFMLCYNKTMYEWYAGSLREYCSVCSNDLLPWKVFLAAKECGYERFDFGGAGNPHIPYGVRDYKEKFGGAIVPLGRYELIHKKWLMILAKIAMHFY